jgi:hypothetical protein
VNKVYPSENIISLTEKKLDLIKELALCEGTKWNHGKPKVWTCLEESRET